jgi:hypothetical protein
MYLHGRDTKYRPVLIIDFARISLERHIIDEYIDLLVALVEFAIDYMLVPGKVEQITVFVDMSSTWFPELQLADIEKVCDVLTRVYPCRFAALFVYRPPSCLGKLKDILS